MTTPLPAQWTCEAYGDVPTDIGAICFVSGELGKRTCGSQGECAAIMKAERQRVWSRINELAAAGAPDAAYLSAQFPLPGDLLNASDDGEAGPPGMS